MKAQHNVSLRLWDWKLQACSGLSETGVSDVATWCSLLGPDAKPSDILSIKGDDNTDDDLQATDDRVWLLGEQRWEVRRR